MLKLFCFTCAGGTTALYDDMKNEIAGNIEVLCFEYAGHGSRTNEGLMYKFDDVLDDAVSFVNSNTTDEDDIALMGYSLGNLIAYEAAAGGHLKKAPVHLFFASHCMPGDPYYKTDYSAMSDEEFGERVKALGGFDKYEKRMLRNGFFRTRIFDPLRADYNIHEQYEDRNHGKLHVPADIFYSKNDIPDERIVLWKNLFSGSLEFHPMGEDHFFIKSCYSDMAEIINSALCGK